MRIEKRDGTDERRIVTALIVNSIVAGRLSARWQEGLFRSRWANIVAEWCVDYYNKYNEPPMQDIEALFTTWAEDWNGDDETVTLVENFLDGLSEEYEQKADNVNPNYITDLAGKYFNKVKLERLAESIVADLGDGKPKRACKRVAEYGQVELGEGAGVDVLKDKQAIKEALTEVNEPLIKYKGALGHFFNDALVRDGFVAIQAPEKRGKTFWLLDMGYRGVEQGRKVAWFGVGDMSQNQMMKRIAVRAARHPMKAGEITYPGGLSREPNDKYAMPDVKHREFKNPLGWKKAYKCLTDMGKAKGSDGQLLFKLSTYPNSSISARGIEAVLQQWERDGWVPDVVVIDYADILAMPNGGDEHRNQINATWKDLRGMSQRLHCLLITATQADAQSYSAETMDMSNFSEDKRKFAHVTGMFGLNQDATEKKAGIYRLNWIVLRESEFDVSKTVHVAGCLAIASPAMFSCF